ncbi:MAG TPA: helix-turn-helix domain-containing protein [Solirubrobacterales bacterium]|jgi:AcrR family transcriptional regulator|nr:helix-turn-helix domain-containing protein [Solirubrobacterales bacterium]
MSSQNSQKRKYEKKQRAEAEAQTRLRITESAVELHGTLGPAQTTMSAVAERAGVRRSTLYRHFPDERALFGACSAHWAENNPPPDISAWSTIEDPGERLDLALAELYAFYRRTEKMLDRLLRDAPTVPVVDELMGALRAFLGEATKILMRGRGLRGNAAKRTRAAIGHALAFRTWQDLTGAQGLDDGQAADLMSRLVAAAG